MKTETFTNGITETVYCYLAEENHLQQMCIRLKMFSDSRLSYALNLKKYWEKLEEQHLVPDFYELNMVDWLQIADMIGWKNA